jgi:hypothetical protein
MLASAEAALDILLAQALLPAQQDCALALAIPSAKMKAKKKIAFFMSQSDNFEKLRNTWCFTKPAVIAKPGAGFIATSKVNIFFPELPVSENLNKQTPIYLPAVHGTCRVRSAV